MSMERKTKVLLIDDDDGFCLFVRKKLNDTGQFEVMAATKGTDGLQIARTLWPDIILLDLVMPDFSGEEVAEELKKHQETAAIPKIFLTALAPNEKPDVDILKKTGNSYFAGKPLRAKDLAVTIKRVLKIK